MVAVLKIDRYLIREIGRTWFATLWILLAIVLSHRLAGFLSKAANGLISRDFILPLLGLQAVYLATALIPLAFLLSIVLTLGRLYYDHEITALSACGYGPPAVQRAIFFLAMPMAVLAGTLSLAIVPMVMETQFEVLARARHAAEMSLFTPGTFREVQGGTHVIYVDTLESGQLGQVFIQSRHSDGTITVTTSAGGHQVTTEEGTRQVVLEHGYRYHGLLGDQTTEVLRFGQAILPLEQAPPPQMAPRREVLPTAQLLYANDAARVAEWHMRLNAPIQVLLIVLWAPPLARLQPRQGRYAKVMAALLLYAIDFNLVGVGESWLMRGRIGNAVGLWWVHGLFLALGVGLIVRERVKR